MLPPKFKEAHTHIVPSLFVAVRARCITLPLALEGYLHAPTPLDPLEISLRLLNCQIYFPPSAMHMSHQ